MELVTLNQIEQEDFASAIAKLQGIHQRAVISIDLSKRNSDFSLDYNELPSKIMKATNLVRS